MSEKSERKVKDIPRPKYIVEKSRQFTTEFADGFVYCIDKEITSLTFYQDHIGWNVDEKGKTNIEGCLRELLLEIRFPTSQIETLSSILVEAIKAARKDGKWSRLGPLPE